MPTEPLLVSAAEACALLGLSRSLFYQLLSSGRIPVASIRFGRKRLWRVDQLRQWTEAGCPSRSQWEGRK